MMDKVVWITGASSGIGEALAHAFANDGALLVLSARREEELERVKENLALNQDKHLILPLDVTEITESNNAVQKVIKHFGRIDILVHNAGISNRSFIKDTQFSVFERVMEVNYFGAVGLTKAVLPYMIEQQYGQFVVISSLTGKFSSPGRGAYAASKHALHGFFDTLRMEHTRDNISVTIICPGFVRTNVTRNSLQGDGSPQGRMDKTTSQGLPPEEAAAKILKATKKKKQEIYFGGKEVLGVYIKRFFPSMLNRIVLSSKENWELGKTVEK